LILTVTGMILSFEQMPGGRLEQKSLHSPDKECRLFQQQIPSKCETSATTNLLTQQSLNPEQV
jgi:hypothetical protein